MASRGSVGEAEQEPAFPVPTTLHPARVACVLVTAVNDHLLKGAGVLPAWLTGKLSDFSGLYFFPFLCFDLWRLARYVFARIRTRSHYGAARGHSDVAFFGVTCAATGLLFAAAKTNGGFHAALVRALDALLPLPVSVARDPGDLVALVSVVVAFLHFRVEESSGHGGDDAGPREPFRGDGAPG